MSTSRSSASESESFAENDVSFEESADDSSQSTSNYHTEPIQQQQPPQQQQQQQQQQHHARQKHYIVETPNARYVVNGNLNGNNISLMPNYHQVKGNSLLPSSQYGSQYFMDNNVIHRTYSYYNQSSVQPQPPLPPQQQQATMQKYQKNPDFVSVRYIAQPPPPSSNSVVDGGTETLMYRNGPYLPYPNGPYQFNMPNTGTGNFKERRIIFGRDAYASEPANYFPYPSTYYNNQAYEPGSQRILNYDVNSVIQPPPPNYDPKRMKMPPHEQMKQIENHEAVSSQWNMSGGFGNSYGINQKFYKELIDNNNNNPPSFNPFYSDNNNNNNNNNNQKNKNNYFGLGNNNSKRSKKNFKIIIGSTILAFIVLCLIVFGVLGIVLPKYYGSKSAATSSVAKSLMLPINMTLNETEIIKLSSESPSSSLARINVISPLNSSLNETSSFKLAENKTFLEIINTTTTLTTTTATTSTLSSTKLTQEQTIADNKNETTNTTTSFPTESFKIQPSFVPETEKIINAFTLKMIPAQILTTSQDLLFELPTTLKSKERLIQAESTTTTTTTATTPTTSSETIKSILKDKILIDNLNATISNATTTTTTTTTTTVGSSLNFDTDAQYIF